MGNNHLLCTSDQQPAATHPHTLFCHHHQDYLSFTVPVCPLIGSYCHCCLTGPCIIKIIEIKYIVFELPPYPHINILCVLCVCAPLTSSCMCIHSSLQSLLTCGWKKCSSIVIMQRGLFSVSIHFYFLNVHRVPPPIVSLW